MKSQLKKLEKPRAPNWKHSIGLLMYQVKPFFGSKDNGSKFDVKNLSIKGQNPKKNFTDKF